MLIITILLIKVHGFVELFGNSEFTASMGTSVTMITTSSGIVSLIIFPQHINIGVYIRLNGTSYHNNSDILITDIGQGNDGALQCITDLFNCCKAMYTTDSCETLGNWIYPNGTGVGVYKASQNFYKDRGRSKVYLYRRIGSISPVGKFCCKVPDATCTHIIVCINLGEWSTWLMKTVAMYMSLL